MNTVATRSSRDTAFAGISVVVSGIIANRLGLTVEEAGLVNVVTFAVLSFGYRAVRHFFPWAADE